ncbi:hypothetical protein GobsT_61890 [Gemmata obscuriglobus]|uniref:Uncharacterized protein n=1 Tax=Gemmata obscuriglobus TaxID=114 RepID=A0A2Z3GXB8_9BACT|nr:hypothetical protein [Gemmata obscuriglobus]AWM36056.1 hypothetical protein C1280_02885 [Gemmata obscuriglobus]QEG31368.1 hypothetical protein GobsT_61890 [Gemmata obscuriglobus]VTS10708.1 unnamed protein product [Gemmata obscuriglobus UQM 2246]
MRPILHLPAGAQLADDSISLAAEVDDMRRLWLLFLAMAVRDEACAIRWQPWESGHALSYTVGAVLYSLVDPGEEFGAVAFEAARRLISPGPRGWLARQLLRAGAGVLRCESEWGPSTWQGVWWSAGAATGVEFVRLDRFPVPRYPVEPVVGSASGPSPG